MEGWIKLHRSITKWQWYQDPSVRMVFEHLLLMANFQDTPYKNILVKKGQVKTTIRSLAKETGLSQQQVRTAISKLKSTHDITTESTNQFTIITIANYIFYQERR